ncbi:site-specific integrase [Thalassotalea eurytherma]|uniref:Tyr recombinase domain-containing protein n=1 Tax=Thalassotalea eurytherma TaxID=1144278 RepID=A0ABQ6H0U3_9GAMM|nr:site-specific integrase [Thalassotalea eurytherma]GLX81717.1 hypothetical protein theurythT_11690 [Thalassotalea eurytherma]
MSTVEKEIIGYTIKNFSLGSPKAIIDEHGECKVLINNSSPLQTFTLLQRHTRQDNELINIEYLDAANNFLIHKKVNDELLNTNTYSTALIHYFHFLETQTIGQGECPKEVICEQCQNRPMRWDEMPFRNSEKPTYKYRKYLKAIYASTDPDEHLARSTCNSYIGVVTNFYKHYLLKGYQFKNKPFEHEILRIELENKSDNIQASSTHVVHTTDLRLKLGRDMRNDGTKRPLIPLSTAEWSEVDRIIRKERQVIKVIDGSQNVARLDVESAFMFLLERHTGIRREEMLTLRHSHIRLPNDKDSSLGYCPIDIGSQSNTKTKGEGNPDRTIHVPIGLMLQLHNYLNSERYIKRKKKYERAVSKSKEVIQEYDQLEKDGVNTPSQKTRSLTAIEKNVEECKAFIDSILVPDEPYLFLNNKGKPYSLSSSNARWCEIRNTVSKSLGYDFEHKPHNLRSTYAVETLKQLITKGMNVDKAIDYIQARLGHVSPDTTMTYLKFAQNELSGHEVYEHALDFILDECDCDMGEY